MKVKILLVDTIHVDDKDHRLCGKKCRMFNEPHYSLKAFCGLTKKVPDLHSAGNGKYHRTRTCRKVEQRAKEQETNGK